MVLAVSVAVGAAQQVQPADPPSPEEIQALVARSIVNQNKNEAALDEYERTERTIVRHKDGTTTETISRVVPHGAGNLRVEMERDGKPTDPASLETQWRNVARSLVTYSDSSNPLVQKDREKAAKRRRERARLVDAVGEAFRFHWVGRTTQDNRTLVEISFEPVPGYKPSVRFGNVFRHIQGTAWVDEASGHVARLEAELFEDVSILGGIVAKLYRGGRLTLEQAEVAPGVWLPTHYSVDIDGRKFIFKSSVHEEIETRGHRRVGPPQEALALIQLDHPGVLNGDQ